MICNNVTHDVKVDERGGTVNDIVYLVHGVQRVHHK
jgi:hypothetical protein